MLIAGRGNTFVIGFATSTLYYDTARRSPGELYTRADLKSPCSP